MATTETDMYHAFVSKVKHRIRQAQYQVLKQVNTTLLVLYWEIGKSIVEKQEHYGWGKSIVQNLATDLQDEFPGVQGYSVQNLWYMRQWYLAYKDNATLQPLVGEISWSHNLLILSTCKDNLEREFYIQMTRKHNWSKNILIHQIEGKAYEKFLLNQTNFDNTLPDTYRQEAKLAVKDEYIFDFLEITDHHNEKELERALLQNIRRVLQEIGGDFAFMGNQ